MEMQILDRAVPYTERHFRTNDGTAVVWPFLNASKGEGPYEFFLDTNTLSKVQWFGQLPEGIRARCVVNPWPALQEQWLSNPRFRQSPKDRINDMIEPLAALGAPFRKDFAQQQERLLRNNDAVLRSQFSLIVPFVAIMKSLLATALSAEDALKKIEALAKRDIPRFTAAMMLSALAVLLKSRQSLKLAADPKPAYSYLESFLAFQSGQKDEVDHINVPYLRNRAGDLNLWLCLPTLRQQGYEFVGVPAIVTGDKALHRLIARVVPPVLHESRTTVFSLSSEGLPEDMCQRIATISAQIRIRTASTSAERSTRVRNLFEAAKLSCLDERESVALDHIFSEWWLPGSEKQFKLF